MKIENSITVRNNDNLKSANAVEFVDKKEFRRRTIEILKCTRDPIYFAQKYFTIIGPTKEKDKDGKQITGKHIIKLYRKQRQLIRTMCEQDRVVVLASRQVGKCLLHSNIIKVKNKRTGKIENITIGKFHEKIKNKHI